ncbi:acyltransferase family protein [Mucilaginibacter lutimaris]|uniref:Acyltransferase family protein n=1 Tax=Mucilaginibacter lutimaris TaxID=931629 RepID=A0ABW2ZMR5_9SPHI
MTFRKTVSSEILNNDIYPSLDGLRALAIIIVVIRHLDIFFYNVFNGGLGVDIFFVLSGFLITSLCLKEKSKTGSLSLKRFYLRRILRIFPIAYLYLILVIILNFIFHLDIAWFQLAGAALFITNFSYFRANSFTPYTGHFWSLSVEEQFYLLFPFLLKKRTNWYFAFILFIVFVLPVICFLQSIIPNINTGILYAFTHYLIKFQGIGVGCFVSILAFKGILDTTALFRYKWAGNLIAIFLIFYIGYDDFYSVKAIYFNLIISLLIGYIIITNLTKSNDVVYWSLNCKPMKFIGKLSYSIYMWQQLFVSEYARMPKFITAYPYNIIGIILIPIASYYLYERYFLKLKNRFKVLSKNA